MVDKVYDPANLKKTGYMKKQEQYQKEEKYEEVDKVTYELWLFQSFSFLEYNPDVKDGLLKITSINLYPEVERATWTPELSWRLLLG